MKIILLSNNISKFVLNAKIINFLIIYIINLTHFYLKINYLLNHNGLNN